MPDEPTRRLESELEGHLLEAVVLGDMTPALDVAIAGYVRWRREHGDLPGDIVRDFTERASNVLPERNLGAKALLARAIVRCTELAYIPQLQ